MILTTTYRLISEAGASSNSGIMKQLNPILGTPPKYGWYRPISIEEIIGHSGINDGLWALRAVHPEQRYAASRLARRLSIKAYDLASRRFEQGNKLLSSAIGLAGSYLDGTVSLDDLRSHRVDVFDRLLSVKGYARNLWYAAWFCLLDRPEIYLKDMLDNLKVAAPSNSTDNLLRRYGKESRSTIEQLLREALVPTDDGCLIGPGVMAPAIEAELQYIPTDRELESMSVPFLEYSLVDLDPLA